MLLLTFSGTAVLLGLAALCAAVLATIYVLRLRLRTESAAAGKRRKHAAFSFTGPLHRLSLCVAIAGTVLAINYTQYDDQPDFCGVDIGELEILDVVIPPTIHKPPPPPPPPPPPVIEKIDEPQVDPPEFVDNSASLDDPPPVIDAPVVPKAPVAPPPPPPPPPPVPEGPEDIKLVAERMPVFGKECFDLPDAERKLCSDRALLSFVQSRIKYPAPARENNIEGMVVVSFTVEKDGSISDVTPVRKVAGGCTEEAVRAINAITEAGERFQPGRQGNRLVRVRFNLPVRFNLE